MGSPGFGKYPLLQDLEQRIRSLEAENFDLKMGMFYLHNGKSEGSEAEANALDRVFSYTTQQNDQEASPSMNPKSRDVLLPRHLAEPMEERHVLSETIGDADGRSDGQSAAEQLASQVSLAYQNRTISQQKKEIQLLQQQISIQSDSHALQVSKLQEELQLRDQELASLREQVSDATLQGYRNEIVVLKRKLENKEQLLEEKEKSLHEFKITAEEVAFLEAQEIERLSIELDRHTKLRAESQAAMNRNEELINQLNVECSTLRAQMQKHTQMHLRRQNELMTALVEVANIHRTYDTSVASTPSRPRSAHGTPATYYQPIPNSMANIAAQRILETQQLAQQQHEHALTTLTLSDGRGTPLHKRTHAQRATSGSPHHTRGNRVDSSLRLTYRLEDILNTPRSKNYPTNMLHSSDSRRANATRDATTTSTRHAESDHRRIGSAPAKSVGADTEHEYNASVYHASPTLASLMKMRNKVETSPLRTPRSRTRGR